MNFEQWMRLVDIAISKFSYDSGITHLDLCDWRYRDAFEDGCSPKEAAQEALQWDIYEGSIDKYGNIK